MSTEEVLFEAGDISGLRMHPGNIHLAQDFLEANPAYTEMVSGRAPRPNEAMLELTDFPDSIRPEDLFVLGLRRAHEMIGFAGVLRSWPVPGVSYISLFQIAEAEHGSGLAQTTYAALEHWMIEAFSPHWLRLGVIEGNLRGRRFWQRVGYHEIEQRPDFEVGLLRHNLRILIKSVRGGDDGAYRQFVAAGSPPPP